MSRRASHLKHMRIENEEDEVYVPLPATRNDIALYVQQLLSSKEQEVCNSATD